MARCQLAMHENGVFSILHGSNTATYFVPIYSLSIKDLNMVTNTIECRSVETDETPIWQTPASPPEKVISEDTQSHLTFNVMPDRPVEETMFIKEYRLWPNYMEAVFDRSYKSSMIHSPDHLIFLSVLISSQKSIYVYVCHLLDIPYDPRGGERMKIWPIDVKVVLPRMVRKREGLVHSIRFPEVRKLDSAKYQLGFQSHVGNTIRVDGEALVFLI